MNANSPMQQAIAKHEASKAEVGEDREFSPQERRQALMALAACSGALRRATEVLAEHGLHVKPSTLNAWKRRNPDEYERIREEFAPKLERELVRLARETAIYAAQVEHKAIQRAEARLDADRDYDPVKTALAMAKIKGTAIDKLYTLTGRPQTIVEHRRAEEIMRSLVSLGVVTLDPVDVCELPAETEPLMERSQDAA